MKKKEYMKLYKEMESSIVSLCNKYDIEYEVEEPKFDFSSKRFHLLNIPVIGGLNICIEPYSAAKGRKREVDLLSVYMRFDTYNNPKDVFDKSRFNEFSFKYNNHTSTLDEWYFMKTFHRDLWRIEGFMNGELLK